MNKSIAQKVEESVTQNYRRAHRIIYHLLARGEFSDSDQPELYSDFIDPDIRQCLRVIAESFDVTLNRVGAMVYLTPNPDNVVLGQSIKSLKNVGSAEMVLAKGYLNSYIPILIISLFYGGPEGMLKTRDYISMKEIVEMIEKRLSKAASKASIEQEEDATGYNIVSVYKFWEALPIDSEKSRLKKSKHGQVKSAVKLLAKNNLLIYRDGEDDDIRTTQKLTDLMKIGVLNIKEKNLFEKLLSEESITKEDLTYA